MSRRRSVVVGKSDNGKGKDKYREVIGDIHEEEEEIERVIANFFKIVYLPFVQNGCFGIPKQFIRIHGEELSDMVVLRVPNGVIWKVKLNKDEKKGSVYFHKGLSELLEYYSLKNGDFLTFKYKGNSNFDVLIFDPSACEIDYGNPSSRKQVSNDERGKSIANLPDVGEDYIQIPYDDEDNTDSVSSSSGFQTMNMGNGERPTTEKKMVTKKSGSRRRSDSSILTRERADSIHKEFKSQHPFFTVAIQSAYVRHKYLPIPAGFKGRHIMENMRSIQVKVADGRSWPLSILPSARNIRLSRGVVDFINDNKLVEGHICVFEMITKLSQCVLKAHIYHP